MSKIKAGIRRGMADAYYRTGQFRRRLRGKVLILAYHRVLSGGDLAGSYVPPGMYVDADVFDAQMRFVKEHFEVLALAQLLEHWTAGSLDEAKRYCVVTFDDGWRDNYLHAYPVLRRLGIPATIFHSTRFVGTDEWFWSERLAHILLNRSEGPAPRDDHRKWSETGVETEIGRWKQMRRADIERALDELMRERGTSLPRERAVMSWDEAAEMSRHRISFGSHSQTHAILTRAAAEDVDRELRGSLRELWERQVNCLPVFCYPNGNYSEEIVDQVRAAGYLAAVCSDSGVEARAPGNLFALRRVGIHNDVSETMPLFAFRLAGLDETLRRHVAPRRRDARLLTA
jgi:peptidoglycan/xylan/chitin deacetylase (PgdA/CDA1 family)